MIRERIDKDVMKIYVNLWFRDFLISFSFLVISILWIFYHPLEMTSILDYFIFVFCFIAFIAMAFFMIPEEEFTIISMKDKKATHSRRFLWFRPHLYIQYIDKNTTVALEEYKNKFRVGLKSEDGIFFPFTSFYLNKNMIGDTVEKVQKFISSR